MISFRRRIQLVLGSVCSVASYANEKVPANTDYLFISLSFETTVDIKLKKRGFNNSPAYKRHA